MNSKQHLPILIIFLFISLSNQAQELIKAKLIDSTTQKPIPYANILLNNKSGVISNEFGTFQMYLNKKIRPSDSLFISCLGFETKRFSVEKFTDSIISLNPKSIELNEILVSNKEYTVDEIIEKTTEQLNSIYNLDYLKNKLFFRESNYTNILKSDVIIKESSIPEFNQDFIDSLMHDVPKHTNSYTEILGNMYGRLTLESPRKFDVIKASRLYDKSQEITFEGYEKKFNEIIKKHVKRDSYFKIKSGWFGTKEEIDSSFFGDKDEKEVEQTKELIEKQKKHELERKNNFLKYRKQTISNLERNSFIFDNTNLNILKKSRKYDFELLDYIFVNDNFVYKIAFSPKRRADYKGVMYINTDDFAVVRLDYENVKPLKSFNLLGISYKENLHRGTLIYSKNDTEKYALKYAEISEGNKFGLKRPIKIIEKNKHVKGRRKQNEISGKIHFIVSNVTKKELVFFESESISETEFNNFIEEAKVTPTYLPKYDPDFWKGHNVIEPNQAIKEFKSIE